MKGVGVFYLAILFLINEESILCNSQVINKGKEIISKSLDDGRLSIIPCILEFYNKYTIVDNLFPGSIVLVSLSPKESALQKNLLAGLNDFHQDFYNTSIFILNTKKSPQIKRYHLVSKVRTYILLADRIDEIPNTLSYWSKLRAWNPSAFIFVILHGAIENARIESQTMVIFEMLLKYRILNAFIVFEVTTAASTADYVEIVNWLPYVGHNCADRINRINKLDQCELSTNYTDRKLKRKQVNETNGIHVQLDIENEFLKTTTNLHRCLLNVSASIWEPFVWYNNETVMLNGSLVSRKVWGGVEVYILSQVAAKLNMTIKFVHNQERRTNRIIDKYHGLYSQLIRGDADILIGGLDKDPTLANNLSETISYMTDDQTWCVQKASLGATWKNVFDVFTPRLWFAVLITFLVMSLLFYVTQNSNQNIFRALLRSLAILVAFSPNIWSHRRFHVRLLFFLFLVYGMLISMMFSCFLVSTLTKQRPQKQINTINETIERRYVYAGGQVAYSQLLQRDDKITKLIRSKYTICEDINECVVGLNDHKTIAVAVSRKHAISYPPIQKLDIFCFSRRENLYTFPVAILTTYKFHLLPKINVIMRRLLEHGLVQGYNDNNLQLKRSDAQANVRNSNSLRNSYYDVIILKFEHISGAVIILFVGHTIAIIIFLFEIVIKRKVKSMRAAYGKDKTKVAHRMIQRKFWIWCDRLISPDCILKKCK